VVAAPAGTSGSTAAAPADSPRELPKTASGLPLVALFGCLALGTALGLRAYRRRLVV
jgi:LPXTG-motif cell wall-anchored protein